MRARTVHDERTGVAAGRERGSRRAFDSDLVFEPCALRVARGAVVHESIEANVDDCTPCEAGSADVLGNGLPEDRGQGRIRRETNGLMFEATLEVDRRDALQALKHL